MRIKYKYLYYSIFLIFFYFIICLALYLFSSLLLIKGKVLTIAPFKNYQINFYIQIGFRNIWQTQEKCISYDNELIYIPSIGSCEFKNVEFNTILNFDYFGRKQDIDLKEYKKSIVILGDSQAMGWGVNDHETFSYLISEKLNIKTYNLAVSSYATYREILRLKKTLLPENPDIIIIQYSNNDFSENQNIYKKNSNLDFSNFVNKKITNFQKIRKILRYSLTIPIELIFKPKTVVLDWESHGIYFFNILNSFDFLRNAKIILININDPNVIFKKFSGVEKNVYYIDLNYDVNDKFIIDGHLNSLGHKKTANTIIDFIKFNKLLEN